MFKFNVCRMFALSGLIALFSSAQATAQDYQEPVTADYFEGAIAGDGLINPVLRFRWYVYGQDGRLVVCGITHLRDAGIRSTIRRMARQATFFVNEEQYTLDVRFFTRANRSEELQTGMATCRMTDIAAPGGGSVGLYYGQGTHRD